MTAEATAPRPSRRSSGSSRPSGPGATGSPPSGTPVGLGPTMAPSGGPTGCGQVRSRGRCVPGRSASASSAGCSSPSGSSRCSGPSASSSPLGGMPGLTVAGSPTSSWLRCHSRTGIPGKCRDRGDGPLSLVAADHPVEVVVIDDGSTDGTGDLVAAMNLPNVVVVRQANAGKAVALNTGLALARHDLVVMVDGDTVFEPTTVRRLVQPFADPTVGAVSGNARWPTAPACSAVGSTSKYVVGFNLDRRLSTWPAVCRPCPEPWGPSGRRRSGRSGSSGGHPRRGHRPDDGAGAGRLAGRLRAAGPGLDRGSGQPGRALAAALPLVLRDPQAMWTHRRSAVDGGASGRFGRRARLPLRLPVPPPTARPGRRRHGRVRAAVPRPAHGGARCGRFRRAPAGRGDVRLPP